MPDGKTIELTAEALIKNGFETIVVETMEEALEKLKSSIPSGAEVMNGSSETLCKIGFMDYLKSGTHGWKNIQEELANEKDMAKQFELRRKALLAEYFVASVNAITQDGKLVSCDASGSRVGAYLFAAKNLVLVAGAHKITKNLDEAIKRVREYVFPLEDQRAMKAYGMHSSTSKWVIQESERPGRIKLILVKEKLGY